MPLFYLFKQTSAYIIVEGIGEVGFQYFQPFFNFFYFLSIIDGSHE